MFSARLRRGIWKGRMRGSGLVAKPLEDLKPLGSLSSRTRKVLLRGCCERILAPILSCRWELPHRPSAASPQCIPTRGPCRCLQQQRYPHRGPQGCTPCHALPGPDVWPDQALPRPPTRSVLSRTRPGVAAQEDLKSASRQWRHAPPAITAPSTCLDAAGRTPNVRQHRRRRGRASLSKAGSRRCDCATRAGLSGQKPSPARPALAMSTATSYFPWAFATFCRNLASTRPTSCLDNRGFLPFCFRGRLFANKRASMDLSRPNRCAMSFGEVWSST